MTTEKDLETRRQEAAAWFARLNQRKVTTQDVTGFSRWRRDPRNALAYERIEALWAAAETLSVDPDMAALTAQAKSRTSEPPRRLALSQLLKPVGIGIGALAVAAALGVWWSNRPLAYQTMAGEQRIIHLADGSKLTLDTASRASVILSGRERRVVLDRGQAFFDVAHDARRPFIVEAGETDITALGTRFDVRRYAGGARVVLVEGRIRVEASDEKRVWTLSPGQQISTHIRAPAIATTDAAASTSWIEGRLTFQGARLDAAIAEFNRYSQAPIVLDAPQLASETVNGVFDSDDRDGFIAALSDLYGVTSAREADGTIRLSSRRSADQNNS